VLTILRPHLAAVAASGSSTPTLACGLGSVAGTPGDPSLVRSRVGQGPWPLPNAGWRMRRLAGAGVVSGCGSATSSATTTTAGAHVHQVGPRPDLQAARRSPRLHKQLEAIALALTGRVSARLAQIRLL
jgi:hypothetical protein